MTPETTPDLYTTTSFRTLGWAGAVLFTLAPPALLYELYLFLYTTAPETNPTIGLFATLSALLSFASVPMMIVGRRERHSISPTTARRPVSR